MRRSLTATMLAAVVLGLDGCGGQGPEITVLDTVVVTWLADDGATAGQIIVAIRNETDRHMDPDVLGRGRQTSARLLADDGSEIPGGDALVQLHSAPGVLPPGEEGYLLGSFSMQPDAPTPAEANVTVNADDVDAPPAVDVLDVETTDGPEGVGMTGRVEWDASGTAVVRAVALGDDGQPIGWTGTSEVRFAPGPFTACCLPPSVSLDAIDELETFGSQAVDQN